jgi:hypothetical protein
LIGYLAFRLRLKKTRDDPGADRLLRVELRDFAAFERRGELALRCAPVLICSSLRNPPSIQGLLPHVVDHHLLA